MVKKLKRSDRDRSLLIPALEGGLNGEGPPTPKRSGSRTGSRQPGPRASRTFSWRSLAEVVLSLRYFGSS